MKIPKLQCQTIKAVDDNDVEIHCENDARYINAAGRLLCSLCDMGWKHASIRISDVPLLLFSLEAIIENPAASIDHEDAIKKLLWRKK